jgi:hypothetical protein
MAESHVISGLVAKRADLSGLVAHHRQEVARLQADLQHLDATIKLFEPDFNLKSIKSKQVRQRSQYFERGEGQRLVLESLRLIGQPALLSVIAQQVATFKAFDTAELPAIEHSLDSILRRAETAGLVIRLSRDSHGTVWGLVPLPQ